MSFNLHPRPFDTLKCEHGECWTWSGAKHACFVQLCREHGSWRLCEWHAYIVQAEHARQCKLPMRYSMEEYRAL